MLGLKLNHVSKRGTVGDMITDVSDGLSPRLYRENFHILLPYVGRPGSTATKPPAKTLVNITI